MSAKGRGVYPGEGCLPRGVVSVQEGVCPRGCLPGVSAQGGVCPGGCIPAYTEADISPVNGMTVRQVYKYYLSTTSFVDSNNDTLSLHILYIESLY